VYPQGSDGEYGIQGPPGIRGLPGFKGHKVRSSLLFDSDNPNLN